MIPAGAFDLSGAARTARAISGPLAYAGRHASRAVVVIVGAPLLGGRRLTLSLLHGLVDRLCDGSVSLRSRVLVDQRRVRAVVAHPGHEVPQWPGAGSNRRPSDFQSVRASKVRSGEDTEAIMR